MGFTQHIPQTEQASHCALDTVSTQPTLYSTIINIRSDQAKATTWVFTNLWREKKKGEQNKLCILCPGNKEQSKASEIHVSNILEKDIQSMKCNCSRFFHKYHTDTALLMATKLIHSCLKQRGCRIRSSKALKCKLKSSNLLSCNACSTPWQRKVWYASLEKKPLH